MTDDLQISVDTEKNEAVIHLRGRLTIETSPDLRERLLAILGKQNQPAAIGIDLAALSYMDTSGLATLVEGLKIARLSGITMRIKGLHGRIDRLFLVTGIGRLFEATSSADGLSS